MGQRAWCLFVVAGFVELLLAPGAFAQNVSPATHGRVGLGVSISNVGDLLVAGSGNTPTSVIAPTIFVPLNLWSRFRVEPEVGFYWTSYVSNTSLGKTSSSRTQTNSIVHIGSGAFGLATEERFTVYYGARIAYLRDAQSVKINGSDSSGVLYPTVPGFFVAPAIGGEYFLSDRLSLGGEVQVRFTSSKANGNVPSGQGSESISAKTISTRGLFTMRFYFLGSKS